jgi:hypothetical protein
MFVTPDIPTVSCGLPSPALAGSSPSSVTWASACLRYAYIDFLKIFIFHYYYLLIRDVYPASEFFHPGSRIRIKVF